MKRHDLISPTPYVEDYATRLRLFTGVQSSRLMVDEGEFAIATGCPLEELEAWLSSYWTQYLVAGAADGDEPVGHCPVLS